MFSRSCHRALLSRQFHPAGHPTPISLSRVLPKSWSPLSRQITTRAAAKKLFKENPISVTLASFCILCGAGSIIYVNYFYQSYIIGEFKAYPEPVAAKLRRAVYYTHTDLQPNAAVKYYRQALEVAEEIGMDLFSDEILGVKIKLAFLMEKINQYDKAIEVLEIVHADCLKWIEKLGSKPGNEANRARILGKTVGISVKLGELYSSDDIYDIEAAEEKLMYAVTAVFKEKKRRAEEGVKEGEGPWISDEEEGGALEALAVHYESRNQHYLAAPLYLQALTLIHKSNCHAVVLMNNLSVCLALQTPPPTGSTPPTSPEALRANARLWALKAVDIAATIKPPNRTEDCDEACAVALGNLGMIARMEGDLAEARKWFQEAMVLAKKGGFDRAGFEEALQKAEEGLKTPEGGG